MKRTATFFCVATLILGIMTPRPVLAAEAEPPGETPSLVINELQTGGCTAGELSGGPGQPTACGTEDGTREFIELYNPATAPTNITGWRVEYLSASHTGVGEPTRVLAELSGTAAANGYILLSYANYLNLADVYFGADNTATGGLLAKSGGSIRVVTQAGATTDLLGWGSAKQIGSWQRVTAPGPGYSVKRVPASDPAYNAAAPFGAPSVPVTPAGGGLILPEPEPAPENPPPDSPGSLDPENPAPQPACDAAILSEILPNPAGADSGQEFIELHNPSNGNVSLLGCQLRLGDTGKPFTMPNVVLKPGEYAAFYDSETKLTLPNASGTTVWLLGVTFEEAVQYPDALGDNESWAEVGGTWQQAQPTPGAPNVALAAEPETESGPESESETAQNNTATPAPCKEGQERNPATNRCRNIQAASSTTIVCKAGQERNPETGRCRNITNASNSAPTPCKAGQERNPDTNRCRNIPTEPEVKPCATGQERNPETGRCRKAATGADTGNVEVQDVESATAATKTGWVVASMAVAGAGGYGVYEWRRDIWGFLSGLKERLKG